MAINKRHLRLVKDQIKPEEVSLDTSSFEAIPDEDELDLLLDEVSDEEFEQAQKSPRRGWWPGVPPRP